MTIPAAKGITVILIAILLFSGCLDDYDTVEAPPGSGTGGGTGGTPIPVKYRFWVYKFCDQNASSEPQIVSDIIPHVQNYLNPALNGKDVEYGIRFLLADLASSMLVRGTTQRLFDDSLSPPNTHALEDYLLLESNSCQNPSILSDINVPREMMRDVYNSDTAFQQMADARATVQGSFISTEWDGDLMREYSEALARRSVKFPDDVYGTNTCNAPQSSPTLRQITVIVVPGVKPPPPVSGPPILFSGAHTARGVMVINSAVYDYSNISNEVTASLVKHPSHMSSNEGSQWFLYSLIFCHEAFHVLQNSYKNSGWAQYLYNNWVTNYRPVADQPAGSPNGSGVDTWWTWLVAESYHHRFWSLFATTHAKSRDTWKNQCMMSKTHSFTTAPVADFSTWDSWVGDSLYRSTQACQICWKETVSAYYR